MHLALADDRALGFEVPVRVSGDIEGSPGCISVGPHGSFELPNGVNREGIHVHMGPDDADSWEVSHADLVKPQVRGPCGMTFEKFRVRVYDFYRLDVHMNTDEANACGLGPNTFCEYVKK